jgi:phenylacetyl-CoA:acceptor oxidoreductase subunit 1
MPRWGMVIDLQKCNGCGSCVSSCQQFNHLPDGLIWRRVPGVEVTVDGFPQRLFLSMSCMHCAKPPCLDVCPTGATYQRDDGIVDITPEHCMGCAYCVVACPYMARTVAHHGAGQGATAGGTGSADLEGTCTKCNFCVPRVEAGLKAGLTPGIDREATPGCVLACESKAIAFGDLDDPESNVSRLLADRRALRIHEDLGTEPSVYYLGAE